MLFAWKKPVRRPFWMKGVAIPLTVAFIDARGRVIQIERMQPQTTAYHWPRESIMAAMEARTPLFQRAGVRVGSKIDAHACDALSFTGR